MDFQMDFLGIFKEKTFKWTSKMIEDLIATIESYKAFLEHKNLDFDADKHVM